MDRFEKLPAAAIRYERGFDVDAVLLSACPRLRARGARTGGFVQSPWTDRSRCPSSLHVIDLRSGQAFKLCEARGACARGCRLDEHGLSETEPSLMAAITEPVDLLVINRFGRAESLGRGLLAVFTAAIEAGIPVLTAVRHSYEEPWERFHGGMGHILPANADTIADFYMGSCRNRLAPAAA